MDDEAERRARLRDRLEREAAVREQTKPAPGRTTLVEQGAASHAAPIPGTPGKTTRVAQQSQAVDVQHVFAQATEVLEGRGNRETAFNLLLDILATHGGGLATQDASRMMSLCIDLATATASRKDASHAPVQRKGIGASSAEPGDLAMRGVAGAAAPLPHLDRIQASFGHHDVSHVRTATGGAASEASQALGASAYAVGDRVGFAGAPDLHTAAHEAAHVVQQRGGVQLKSGIDAGKTDPMEQHADTVADAVVRGEPAQALLDQVGGHGQGVNVVQRKGVGASLHPLSGDYCNTYRIKIMAAIADRIRAVGLPKPHPRLYWADKVKAEQAIIDVLWNDIELLQDKTLHRLMEHSYPADLYSIVDASRQGASPRQQGEWHAVVGVAIANALSEPLDASIQRMALRLRVQLDGPARGIPHNAHLIPSCPLDSLVGEALTKPGVIGGVERTSRVDDTPGKPFARGAEPVTFQLVGKHDPKLWNWIEVTSPKSATVEDVASTELIPGKPDSVMGTTQSYRIAASPPYFGIPIEVARQVEDMRDLASEGDQDKAKRGDFGRVADAEVLHKSDVSFDAAVAQAAPAEPHTPSLDRLLGRVEVQIDAIETRLAPVKAALPLSGAKRFVAHCRDELSNNPKGAKRLVPAVAGQEGILHAVSSELVALFDELHKHRAKTRVQGETLPAAISNLIGAYAGAAGASHLATEANTLLADARRQKALLPITLIDDEVRGARDAVAAQGETSERGGDDNVSALPKAMTGVADVRLRLTRGEAVSNTQVSQINSDSIELATRARLTTLAGTVRTLRQQAVEAKVENGTAPGGWWSVQKIVDMMLDLIYGEEKSHSQFEGADKLHGGWMKRLDLAKKKASEPGGKDPSGMWMQPAINYVDGELALMDSQLGSMRDFIKWCNEQIAYAKVKQLLKSMAWQIGLMIVTGEIAGAGLAAVRGIAMAGEIAEDVRGASLLWKGAEVLVHSGLQTVASGATGGEISGTAFAENALGMLLTSAAMKPFKSLLAGDAALEQTVEKELSTLGKIGKIAKAGAKIGTEATIDLGAGVIGSGVAHAVVNGTELGIASRDEWMTQGFALAASAFVSAHTQGMYARISEVAKDFRQANMPQAAERLDALAVRAEKLKARAGSKRQPSPDEAGAMLVERHEILTSEYAVYREFGGDKAAAKQNAADRSAMDSNFIEVPFQLAGLSPVVDGLSYEGTGKQIKNALAAAASNGIELVPTCNESGTWNINLGDRTLTIKELDYKPGEKSEKKSVRTTSDGMGLGSESIDLPPRLASKGAKLTHTPRPEALRELLIEAEESKISIHSDDEAQRLLDWAARSEGVAPANYHAVTIGEDIFVRPEHAQNVRILREELIHVSQQRAGIGSHQIVEAEIEARLMMIRYRLKWGITNEEVIEMIREVRIMRRTGKY
jgi:hypothetical protein